VFQALPEKSSGEEQSIANYTYKEFVAYYLLTMVARAFSSMPGLSSQIAGQIRSGEIKKFLIQPIDPLGFLLLSRMAHKLAYYAVAVGPFVLVFFLCRDYFLKWPDATTWLLFVYMLFSFFLSGHMFPIDMLQEHEPWATIIGILPLQYLAYFPAAVFLGKVEGWDLVRGLGWELFWVVFFIILSRILWIRGTRRYSAYGG
jgi:ABC-2 type transport system permease protein